MVSISKAARRPALGATLQALKATPGANTADGRMKRETFSPNPGALGMWLHVPKPRPHQAALVVVLHGCTQDAVGFAADGGWLTLADEAGFAVLAPQQGLANNANRCFNWFEPGDMRRGSGEPASIAAMITTAIAQHDLDPDRVYITGLSAGGAMTAVMLATYPELFAGGAVVAGLPYGAAVGMSQAFQAMQTGGGMTPARLPGVTQDALPRLTIWHGDADHVVNGANGGQIARQWAAGQGLAIDPDDTAQTPTFSRSTWRDETGEVRIELNRVRGLGHGVPLETGGPKGLGRVAPYMLQAGVNSTREIAAFWGLAEAGDVAMPPPTLEALDAAAAPSVRVPMEAHAPDDSVGLGARVMSAVSAVPPRVQAIIADALTRAGLLK